MYADYKAEMEKAKQTPVASCHHYRDIFCSEYNIGFHQPKKDQCDECTVFRNLSAEEKQTAEENHNQHISNKDRARINMQTDKDYAISDASVCCASFDLQKVLNVPRAHSCSYYYKRKVAIYNFTVYDMASKQGNQHCLVSFKSDRTIIFYHSKTFFLKQMKFQGTATYGTKQ